MDQLDELRMTENVMFAGKKFYVVETSANLFNVFCPCSVLNRYIKVTMTGEQVEEVLLRERGKRRFMEDIFPDLPPPVREIFISGTTPAEWAALVLGIGARSDEFYASFGYVFSEK